MTPTSNSEAIQLAEASDWKGLQRLIEKAPEHAQGMDEYGMLPIHWACTESHVPVALLNQLISAYAKGATMKNDAGLLPLHIAIRARVDKDWLATLIAAFPDAVHVQTPEHISVLELAAQAGLSEESVSLLRNAIQIKNPKNIDSQSNILKVDDNQRLHIHETDLVHNETPVSPAHSLRSVSSLTSDSMILLQDDEAPMISPSSKSSSCSHGSVDSALLQAHTLPRSLPIPSPFERKHSLDFPSHAAAAAAAARQHQELMVSQNGGNAGTRPPSPPTGLRTTLGGRHQSLPLIPSFEHLAFLPPHYEHTLHGAQESILSEEEIIDNQTHSQYSLPAPRRSSFMIRRKGAHRDRASLSHSRTFESPPEWKRSDECSICRASFGVFKHRHHCRNCGKSICSQHSADHKLLMEAKGFKTPQRVCVTCYAMIQHHSSQNSRGVKVERRRSIAAVSQPIITYGSPQPHPSILSMRADGLTNMSSPTSTTTSKAPGASNGVTQVDSTTKKMALVQTHMNDMRCLLQQQQQQIQHLTHTTLHLQQQLIEQEELKAETMLLLTQLMTRVSTLELQKHTEENER